MNGKLLKKLRLCSFIAKACNTSRLVGPTNLQSSPWFRGLYILGRIFLEDHLTTLLNNLCLFWTTVSLPGYHQLCLNSHRPSDATNEKKAFQGPIPRAASKNHPSKHPKAMLNKLTRSSWWFQIFFIFTPTWGRFPF